MTPDIQIIGPIGWRYAFYEDIAANKRKWWLDSEFMLCNYQAYAAKRDGQKCIVIFRITEIEDGHKVQFRNPDEPILSIEQLQEAFSEKTASPTPPKPE